MSHSPIATFLYAESEVYCVDKVMKLLVETLKQIPVK